MTDPAATPSIDEILAAPQTRRRRSVDVSLRWDLVERLNELEAALAEARRLDESSNTPVEDLRAPVLAEQIVAVQEELRATEITFVFESIGTRAWADLIAQHPPTAEHRKAGLDHNPNTFPQAAIAASCVAPTGMTPEKVSALFARTDATIGVYNALWAACCAANMDGRRPGESAAASAVLQRSRPNSESHEPTESLAAS